VQPEVVVPDLRLLHALLGHYARLLWDVQKVRIAMSNRVAAMVRDQLAEEWRLPAQTAADALLLTERGIDRQLERLARQHPMRRWVEQAPGIGLPGFARLMGITGPLSNFATVSKLWHYLGLHVVDGAAPRLVRGQKLTHSPQGRMVCHQLAEAIVKVGRGPYRAAYDAKKAYYEAERPDWTQAHRHEAAMRYAVKELLKDMWIEWRSAVPSL
jgi:hypothetical protein